MRIRTSRTRDREADDQSELAATAETQVSDQDVEAVLAEVDCCLAEAAQDDERAARRAFEDSRRQWRADERDEPVAMNAYLDRGDLLRAKYAHTNYVRSGVCCTCGCPWRDSGGKRARR